MVEIIFATQERESQVIFISANLQIEVSQAILTLLQEFIDAFACMPKCQGTIHN